MVSTVEYMIYGFFLWGLLSTAVLVMIVSFTPALQFLITRFVKSKSLLILIHKGNRLSFVTAKYTAGCFKTKNHGVFDETSNSTYFAYRTPVYFAPEYYSHTMPHTHPMNVQGAKEKYDFQNIDELYNLSKKEPSAEISLANNKTIRMGDLLHMFPFIDDPHIREKEQASQYLIAKGMGGKKDWYTYLMYVFIAGLIGFIIWKMFLSKPSQAVEVVCKYPDIINNAGIIASNLTI